MNTFIQKDLFQFCVSIHLYTNISEMKFISETVIDTVVERLGTSDATVLESFERFKNQVPNLAAFITCENHDVFQEEEQDLLLFMAMVIYESILFEKEEVLAPNLDKIAITEEENWNILQASTSKEFRKRITPFFEGTDQEDLLAFVEDTLMDEDGLVTKEGRIALFLVMKTLIDLVTY